MAVFFSEVLKLGSAVALLALEQRSLTRAFSLTARLLSEHGRETLQFAVPALCYTLQNNLWFYALSNLDPVTAAVTSQVKVITTAIASVVMLGRRLNGAQWLAPGLPSASSSSRRSSSRRRRRRAEGADEHAVGRVRCCWRRCSRHSGVFLERLFKTIKLTLWLQSIQLSLLPSPSPG